MSATADAGVSVGRACEHVFVGPDARPYARLVRALERMQLPQAESAARECEVVPLGDALGLCVLMAIAGEDRFERASTHWLRRLLNETAPLHLNQLAVVVEALQALPGARADLAVTQMESGLRSAGLRDLAQRIRRLEPQSQAS